MIRRRIRVAGKRERRRRAALVRLARRFKHFIGDIQRDSNTLSLHGRAQFVRDCAIQGEAQLAVASLCVSSLYLKGNGKIQRFLIKKKSKLFKLNGKSIYSSNHLINITI